MPKISLSNAQLILKIIILCVIPTQNHHSQIYVSDVTNIVLPLSISYTQKGLIKRKSLCKEFKEELTGTSNHL